MNKLARVPQVGLVAADRPGRVAQREDRVLPRDELVAHLHRKPEEGQEGLYREDRRDVGHEVALPARRQRRDELGELAA
ncbi:hypothetical protein [Candidatus Frankia alpina]|uniref:hypothetical protein n=1 Tax=Candidatus Frankia alpina TaxID=2699483 RepID=UPI001F19D0CF|nr:hypothetical protein [Candidatus Frankia alpina]